MWPRNDPREQGNLGEMEGEYRVSSPVKYLNNPRLKQHAIDSPTRNATMPIFTGPTVILVSVCSIHHSIHTLSVLLILRILACTNCISLNGPLNSLSVLPIAKYHHQIEENKFMNNAFRKIYCPAANHHHQQQLTRFHRSIRARYRRKSAQSLSTLITVIPQALPFWKRVGFKCVWIIRSNKAMHHLGLGEPQDGLTMSALCRPGRGEISFNAQRFWHNSTEQHPNFPVETMGRSSNSKDRHVSTGCDVIVKRLWRFAEPSALRIPFPKVVQRAPPPPPFSPFSPVLRAICTATPVAGAQPKASHEDAPRVSNLSLRACVRACVRQLDACAPVCGKVWRGPARACAQVCRATHMAEIESARRTQNWHVCERAEKGCIMICALEEKENTDTSWSQSGSARNNRERR